MFGGVWFPSRRIELFVPESGYQRFRRATPEIGLRAGYYPLRWVGVEAEGAVLPTRTAGLTALAALLPGGPFVMDRRLKALDSADA